jgi:hypothetical protein
LADRERFVAWLQRLAELRGRSLELGSAERGAIVELGSDLILGCVTQGQLGFCQLGVSAGPDPSAHLRRLLELRASPRAAAELERSLSSLGPDADALLALQPAAVLEALAAAWMREVARRHRFDDEPARQVALRNARAEIARWRHAGRAIDAIALGLWLRPNQLELDLELSIDERGARSVEALAPAPGDDPVVRWSEMPALARAMVRLKPRAIRPILEQLGVPLPAGALAGTAAALLLGVDTECPMAKAGAPRSIGALAYALPIAAAIGLSHPLDSAELAAIAGSRTATQAASTSADAAEAGSLGVPIAGHALELRAAPDVLLVGTGIGSGAAAARRWSALALDSSGDHGAHMRGGAPPFLELGVDLAAAHAAFQAGSFGEDTRPELLDLERLHRHLRPALERYREVALLGWIAEHGHRVRFTLSARSQ